MPSNRSLGVVAMASAAYYVVAIGALHLLQPDFEPLRRPMSAYVLGAYPLLMTTTFFALAAGLFSVGLGLHNSLSSTRLSRVASVVMMIAVAGVLVAGFFPMDGAPEAQTSAGRLHRIASMFAFPAMTLAPFLFSLGFRRDGSWRAEASTALALSFGIIAAFIGFVATRDLGGLAQRVFIALLLCWTVIMGRHFVRLPHAR